MTVVQLLTMLFVFGIIALIFVAILIFILKDSIPVFVQWIKKKLSKKEDDSTQKSPIAQDGEPTTN